MKITHYELTLQLLSRDGSDGGFVAEAHVVVKLPPVDLAKLSLDEFSERYLQPALKQAFEEHERQLALVVEAFNRRHA